MAMFSPVRWLRELPLQSKFTVIIGLVLFLIVVNLFNFWLAMTIVSDIRAYVGGESLWSKAQKEASFKLNRYANTFEAHYYDDFVESLKVQAGDHQARTELLKPDYDYDIAYQGFLQGGNHPDDAGGLIFLFRNFRWVSYMNHAIAVWTEADGKIERLRAVGESMRVLISQEKVSPSSQRELQLRRKLAPLIDENERLDAELTELESEFSNTLGEGSRVIGFALLVIATAIKLLLGGLVVYVAWYIGKVVSRVDTAKSEFVALASHQLRTPLTVIRWAAEEMQLTGKDRSEEDTKNLKLIVSTSMEMAALISAVLDVSRVELGQLTVRLSRLDLVGVARATVKETESQAKERDVEVVSTLPASLQFSADHDLLRIVLQNLLTNAIKYSRRGGAVQFSVIEEPHRVLVRVADNGVGIPKKDRMNVFKKMFRASNSGQTGSDGSGLGLYVVQQIVQKTGGKVWFESEEGKGTTFFVAWPIGGMHRQALDIPMGV